LTCRAERAIIGVRKRAANPASHSIAAGAAQAERTRWLQETNKMKRIVLLAFLSAIIVGTGFADELRTSDPCTIQEAGMFDKDKIVSVKLQNAEIQAQCKLHSGKFMEDYALYAVPWITNLAGKKLTVSYHAAFFDSKGELVACVSQNADIPADASGYQLGSSMAMIPKATIQNIKSYKIVIYTSKSKEE
jgi:hypothetical protein